MLVNYFETLHTILNFRLNQETNANTNYLEDTTLAKIIHIMYLLTYFMHPLTLKGNFDKKYKSNFHMTSSNFHMTITRQF